MDMPLECWQLVNTVMLKQPKPQQIYCSSTGNFDIYKMVVYFVILDCPYVVYNLSRLKMGYQSWKNLNLFSGTL